MLRTALLRSRYASPVAARMGLHTSCIASRCTTRPAAVLASASSRAVVRVALAPAPRAPAFLRGYSSGGGGLTEESVFIRIGALLSGFDKVNDPANITPRAHFANDLGLDSLDTVEVVMAIEEEFSIEIPDKDADSIHSVDQAIKYILNQPDAA